MEITPEREKVFWENYGLKYIYESTPQRACNGWFDANGQFIGYLPSIKSLDDLFKFAVTIAIEKMKAGVSANYVGNAYQRLFSLWQKELFFTNWENPSVALFLVLEKVVNES